MTPRPAQYLLRFDDFCPTMSRARWQRFLPIIHKFGIRPILAVVPDNRDAELEVDEPDPEFWAQMRAMEAAGATIGLHGYRHLCVSHGRSFLPSHQFSEFAGVPAGTQQEWIRAGLKILRAHGLNPRIWVAPRHGLDGVTLRVLKEEGIGLVSDGLTHTPFIRGDLTWIPQQLWAPEKKTNGLWTILFHANTTPDTLVRQLEAFVTVHSAQFTCVDRIIAEFVPAELTLTGRIQETLELLSMKQREVLKRIRGRS